MDLMLFTVGLVCLFFSKNYATCELFKDMPLSIPKQIVIDGKLVM